MMMDEESQGRATFYGKDAGVYGSMAWPTDLPLLHPRHVKKLIDVGVEKRPMKNFLTTYEDAFQANDVIECIAKERDHENVRVHPQEVLDFLETARVLVSVGHGHNIKSLGKRLYRMVPDQTAVGYGVCFVHIDGASGLLAGSIEGTSNPYATVEIGSTTRSTKVVCKDLNPSWKETFAFFVQFDPNIDTQASVFERKGTHNVEPEFNRKELGITLNVSGQRKGKGRIDLGCTSKLLLRSVHMTKRGVKNAESIPSVDLSLKVFKKGENVLLAMRAAFKGGGPKSKSSAFLSDVDSNISRGTLDSSNTPSFQEFRKLPEMEFIGEDDDNEDEDDEEEGQEEGGYYKGSKNDANKGGAADWDGKDHLNKSNSGSEDESAQTSHDTLLSRLKYAKIDEDGEDSMTKMGRIRVRAVWMEYFRNPAPTAAVMKEKNKSFVTPLKTMASTSVEDGDGPPQIIHEAKTIQPLKKAEEEATMKTLKKSKSQRMKRMLSMRRSKTSQQEPATPPKEKMLGLSLEVLFQEQQRNAEKLIELRHLKIEQALLAHEKEIASAPSLSEGAEPTERIFLFEHTRTAFELISEDGEHITRSMWVSLAPLLYPLCHFMNAHEIFGTLIVAQFGERVAKAIAMSGQLRSLQYEVFEKYVKALQEERTQTQKMLFKLVQDFPDLAKDIKPREEILMFRENVRGGREEVSFLRKSQFGGKLLVSTDAIYYGRKRIFHQNNYLREDLKHSVQVLESNGSVDYGLMIGFKNKIVPPVTKKPRKEKANFGLRPFSLMKSKDEGKLATASTITGDDKISNEEDIDLQTEMYEYEDSFSTTTSNTNINNSNHDGSDIAKKTRAQVDQVFRSLVDTDGEEAYAEQLSGEEEEDEEPGTGHFEESDVETIDDDINSTDPQHRRIRPTLERFRVQLPPATVSRYMVLRFPSYGSWWRRDLDILIIRDLIAFRIFCEHVLFELVNNEISKMTSHGEVVDKASFCEEVKRMAQQALELEILSFKTLMRMTPNEDKKEWSWLNAVDTYESFGDRWSWKRWTPLAFLNLVLGACQPESKKVEKIKRKANACLFSFAMDTILETASLLDVQIKWNQDSRLRVILDPEVNKTTMHGHIRQSGAFAKVMVPGAKEKMTPMYIDNNMINSKHKRISIKLEDRSRTMVVCRQSLDDYWKLVTLLRQQEYIFQATKLKSMGQNVDLFLSIAEPVIDAGKLMKEIYDDLLLWKNPGMTIGIGLTTLIFIVRGYSAYTLGTVIICTGLYLIHLKHIRERHGFKKLYVPIKRKKTLFQKYKDMKEKYAKAKHVMQTLNLRLLRVRALLTWENEDVTYKLAFLLFFLGFLVLILPRMAYELAVWVYIFTKKFRSGRISRKIKAYLNHAWKQVPPTPLWEKKPQESK